MSANSSASPVPAAPFWDGEQLVVRTGSTLGNACMRCGSDLALRERIVIGRDYGGVTRATPSGSAVEAAIGAVEVLTAPEGSFTGYLCGTCRVRLWKRRGLSALLLLATVALLVAGARQLTQTPPPNWAIGCIIVALVVLLPMWVLLTFAAREPNQILKVDEDRVWISDVHPHAAPPLTPPRVD